MGTPEHLHTAEQFKKELRHLLAYCDRILVTEVRSEAPNRRAMMYFGELCAMLLHQRMRVVGCFALPDGQRLPPCDVSVEIAQLGSGSTFLYCSSEDGLALLPFMVKVGPAVSFVGHTDDGVSVRTSDLRIYLGQKTDRHCFSVSQVIIGDPAATYRSIELAVTNVVFERDGKQGQSFTVSVGDSPLSVGLVPVENYDDLVFHLIQTDCPTVTAKLTLAPISLPTEALDSLVDDLCATLSIMQGRKIYWIQRTAYSPQDRIAWSELGETITKEYTHGLLCFDPEKQTGIKLSLDGFASVFPKVREFREAYDPDRRIVNSWLDARLQNDYLEARTLKYAIVLETLCRRVESKHDDVPSTYVDKSAWRSTGREFLPRIKEHLADSFGLEAHAIERICTSSNWGNLNRVGFRTNLAACLQKLGIKMHDGPERIRRVTDVRNKIVHSLSYLTTDDFKELNWPAINGDQQHSLIACFVEEALLRLFGLGDHMPES